MALGLKGLSLVKSGFICCTVLWAALSLKLMYPVLSELGSYTVLCFQACVKPPYLYLLVNLIILAVVASSRFQQAAVNNHQHNFKTQYSVPPPQATTAAYTPAYTGPQVTAIYSQNGSFPVMDEAVVIGTPVPMQMVLYEEQSKGETVPFEGPTVEKMDFFDDQKLFDEEEDKFVVSEWNLKANEMEIPPAKPVKNRHRKNSKSMSEDGRGLKQSRQTETLESVWRRITEGRQMMKKSDTWNTHSRPITSADDSDGKSIKSVFDPRLSASARSNRVVGVEIGRAESPSQDELNRRVEAFINKFNEEMRLQREESIRQYNDMLRRGAY